MKNGDGKAAVEMVGLIRDLIIEELDKRDSTEVCKIATVNSDGTYNILIPPDDRNVIRNVKSISPDKLEQGDVAYIYKFLGKLNNAIIIAKIGANSSDLRFLTVDDIPLFEGSSSSSGGDGDVTDVLMNGVSVVDSDGVAHVTDHYPTTFTWTSGTTSGPTGSLTGNTGFTAVSFGAIPSATLAQSGVVTTGDQAFAGTKTFESIIFQNNNALVIAPPQMTATGPGEITISPWNVNGSNLVLNSHGIGSLKITNDGVLSLDNLGSGGTTRQRSYLQLPQNKGTSQLAAILATLDDVPTNLENGATTGSLEQTHDGSSFTFVNPNSPLNNTSVSIGIATGTYASMFGGKGRVEGKRGFVNGTQVVATGNYSHAEGNNTHASGANSHAEGSQTMSSGNASHSEGTGTLASGNNSHAFGNSTIASGYNSIAGGEYSKAEQDNTFALGHYSYVGNTDQQYTVPSGGGGGSGGGTVEQSTTKSYAIGDHTQALGSYAFVGGYYSKVTAKGQGSFVYGSQCEASGLDGACFGQGTKNINAGQIAVGRWNTPKNNTLFEVGNGADNTHRSNAFEVYADGHATVGHDPINNMDVVTKQYVDNAVSPLSTVSISQSTASGTASRPETTTTSITVNGTTTDVVSYTHIDTALSSSSRNPVANSTIYNAISNKVDAEDFQELEEIALTTRGVLTGEPLTPVLSITDGNYYPIVSDSNNRWKFSKSDDPTFFKIYDVSNYTSVHLKSVSRAGHILTNTIPSDFSVKIHQNPSQKPNWYEYPEASGTPYGTNSEQANVLPKTGYTPYDKDITTNGKHYLIVYEVNAAQAIEVVNGGGYSPITTSMFVNDGDGTTQNDPYAKISDITTPTFVATTFNPGTAITFSQEDLADMYENQYDIIRVTTEILPNVFFNLSFRKSVDTEASGLTSVKYDYTTCANNNQLEEICFQVLKSNDTYSTTSYHLQLANSPITDVQTSDGTSIVNNTIATLPGLYAHNIEIIGSRGSRTNVFCTLITSFATSFDLSSFIAYINNMSAAGTNLGIAATGTVTYNRAGGVEYCRTAARVAPGVAANSTITLVYHNAGDAAVTSLVVGQGTGDLDLTSLTDAVVKIM